ncbi:hypothetical protein CkaCkLH20_06552 [Colletotrichum karsti]|uniref:Nitrogen regulatory protein areA GATA-like domain-containing protein n=1 Tax=Colletotrichum karsti TaxID=1095194 RepID=A0A9P6LKF7_9PEZI|nr:uncharacterized protein CkaCkLH20_06552 [Colletotrichum karsti]KAF9876106.1 hypothetical protein CkaCkLH20_06552 [Colletotrichum karsti]
MPYPLATHVLTVDPNVIHKVDTSNPQNLYSMWTVFAKCAESVEQGRRLENLSWRMWNHETFCCAEEEEASITATSQPREIPQSSRLQDLPQLSSSVDSENNEEAVEFTSNSAPLDIRPQIQRQDSSASNRSRGKERHITADDFEKMVVTIIKHEPLSAPLPQIASPYMPPQKETPDLAPASPAYEHSGSTTTESPCKSSSEDLHEPPSPEVTSHTTVVRGFSPSQIPVSRPFPASPKVVLSPAAIPEPSSSPAAKRVQSKKQPMFALGGSCSSSEQGQSIEQLRPIPAPAPKRNKMFLVGGSSEEDSSLKSALASGPSSLLNGQKKTASFADQVVTRTINDNNSAIADDSETDYVDESAIDDDDDSSDWEDSIEDSNKSSLDDKTLFQRVDSKVNLTSRRSLISMMIEQKDRSHNLGNIASQSTSALPWSRTSHPAPPTLAVSPNDSDDAPLMMKRGIRSSPLKPINEVPRSAAQPITATASHSHLQAALSPRTTRRNMLATELTESLRRNLLWERQQKSSTANAVLKRRHTSHDVANLKQYPEKPYMNQNTNEDVAVGPQYFSKDTDNFGGYHSKGW